MARLEDRHLAKIGGKLSVKALKMISVVYGMGLEQHELEDIESAGRADKDGKKRKILIKWRNSGGKKEDLANILYTSRYVDEDEIRTHLELPAEFEFTETEFPKPGKGEKLQQRELGILALKTERADMSNFAVTSLGCSEAEVLNISSDNREDSWSTMFEILVRWSRKKGNTRQKLIDELIKAKIESDLVQQVLGEGSSDSMDGGASGKTKSSAKEPLTGEENETDGALQTDTNVQSGVPKIGEAHTTDSSVPPAEKIQEKKDTWIKTRLGFSFIVVTICVLTITGSLSPDNQSQQPTKDHIYPMETSPKGYVLIINNKVFYNDPGSSNTRHGTDNDVERLKQVFGKLGYEVVEKRDLTASDIRQQMKMFAQREEHDSASASVVVILSHGRNGAIIGTDGKQAQIDHLINEFSSDNSRVLAGKPKLFLFQACRGEGLDYSKDSENEVELHLEHITKMGRIIPRFADIIVGYSTDPGLYSLRNPHVGSIFIQAFCDVVDEYADTTDLLSITTKINAKMAESKYRTNGKSVAQMSEFISKLTKTWKLSNIPRSQHEEL